MKRQDLIANIELGFAMAFIALWPAARPDDLPLLYWISHVVHFGAFFAFLDGLRRFRVGISQEIEDKLGKVR